MLSPVAFTVKVAVLPSSVVTSLGSVVMAGAATTVSLADWLATTVP